MSGQTPETIEDMLRDVREAFRMDVAFVSKFDGDRLVFRKLEGDSESFGWQEGQSFPLDESYCKRVLDGRIPQVGPRRQARGGDQGPQGDQRGRHGQLLRGGAGALR